jgi:hypothetical protein
LPVNFTKIRDYTKLASDLLDLSFNKNAKPHVIPKEYSFKNQTLATWNEYIPNIAKKTNFSLCYSYST